MSEYECGTCGSRSICLIALPGFEWRVTCGQGHVLIPTPGFELTVEEAAANADV